MLDKTHIFCVQYESSLLVLEYRIKLIGAFFLHKMISPPTGLCALAAIGIAVGKVLRKQTSSRKADTHRAVNKALYLQLIRRFSSYLCNFIKRQFSCQHHSFCAHVIELICSDIIHHSRLCRDMYLSIGREFLSQRQKPQIGDYQCIDTCIYRSLYKAFKLRYLVVSRQCIAGKVYPLAATVCFCTPLCQKFRSKFSRSCPHTKGSSSKIDCICAIIKRSIQSFHIAYRRQNFQ